MEPVELRIAREVRTLRKNFLVESADEDQRNFFVLFEAPKGCLYEGGFWRVHVTFGTTYPQKAPTLTFVNQILHPNISETGAVCISHLKEQWEPSFTLDQIFSLFLPAVVSAPNFLDALNEDAYELWDMDDVYYEEMVRVYVDKFATKEIAGFAAVDELAEVEVDELAEGLAAVL